MDIHTFFEQALPAVIERHHAVFDRHRGSVCIIVHGAGAWTLRFGDHADPGALSDDIDLDADLVVSWSSAQFAALLAGEAEQDQLVPVTLGDTALLKAVGNLLQPPAKGGLGARFLNT